MIYKRNTSKKNTAAQNPNIYYKTAGYIDFFVLTTLTCEKIVTF